MKMEKITGYESYELNHTFDTEAVEALDHILIPAEADKLIFSFKAEAGNDDIPAVKEKLIESFIVPEGVPGVKEKLVEEYIIPIIAPATAYTHTFTITSGATVVAGPKPISFSTNFGATSDEADITDGMTADQVAAALRALTLQNYIITGEGPEVILTFFMLGNVLESINLEMDGDITCTYTEFTENGTYEGGAMNDLTAQTIDVSSLVAGTMTVQFNDELPVVPISIVGTESASDIYDLIVLATPESHSATNFAGQALILLKNDNGANVQRIIIGPGGTGAVVNVLQYQDGVDPIGAGIVPGNISIYYNSATATEVPIAGDETSSADVADKIVLYAPIGYTVATVGNTISIEKDLVGENIIPISISLGSTGITKDSSVLTPGVNEISGVVPGNISVYYNIASATLVALDGTETTSSDITDKIVALAPGTYTVANDAGSVSIEKKVGGANLIPLSISFGDTGVTEDASTFTAGADLIHGGGAEKATVIDLEYSIDTRRELNAGTAKWVKIESNGSASAYKEFIYTHPVSAIRGKVVTAASDSTCKFIVKAIR